MILNCWGSLTEKKTLKVISFHAVQLVPLSALFTNQTSFPFTGTLTEFHLYGLHYP